MLARPNGSLKRRAYRATKRMVARAGFDLTQRHFYSPIPGPLPESTWHERNQMHGVRLDLDEQLAWLAAHVSPFTAEFQPPVQIGPDYRFEYENGSFGNGDADVLYGIVRSLRPSRIVELGSGHTSAVISHAVTRNAADGHITQHTAYDPFPAPHVAGLVDVRALPAEAVPTDAISELGAGDVLFVDTTHTVRIGGDVVRIVLDLLPLVAPGVLIHFHDVFLPYAYPRHFFEEHEFYWAEQYLLQAFLAYNDRFAPVVALHALARERATELGRLVPSMAGGGAPGSFWIARREA